MLHRSLIAECNNVLQVFGGNDAQWFLLWLYVVLLLLLKTGAC
jgi:hypothetical protein